MEDQNSGGSAPAGEAVEHRTEVGIIEEAQAASASCSGCGWSTFVTYARPVTGAPVALRLAGIYAKRHEADPAAEIPEVQQ